MDRIYEDNNDVSAIFFDLDNTLIQTRKGDNKACNKLVDILVREYGLRHEVASESAASFLKAFRERPDDEFYAIDEWPTHLWRNCLPNNYRHIAKNISAQWLTLRFQYLALTQDVIHLLESLSSVVAQRVTKLWAPRAQLLGLNCNCKICEGVHQEALYRHVNNEELVNEWHREDYLLGLITNGPSRAQWQKIQRLDLEKYFDCVLVSGDHPWEKPDQNIFLEACKLLNVEARTCIMVGDKLETDIKGGIDAELGGTVWIPLQYDEMVSDLPDFKIQKVTELPEVLPNSPKLKKRQS